MIILIRVFKNNYIIEIAFMQKLNNKCAIHFCITKIFYFLPFHTKRKRSMDLESSDNLKQNNS